MTADVADAKTDEAPKKRGGQRGERPWRDKPTARERVMNQNLAEFIKEATDKDVSPETIRAVRYCLNKWSNSDATKALRENMDKKLEKAKLQDKREKALAMLKEADSELSKYDSDGDLDDDDGDDEDEETFDDTDSDSDDDDDDVFGD
ncbi:methyltransferase [Mycobacterium phage Fowlmouth]|uniref:Uncharacterized protein n=1 Tax=Mycobacterium phage Fowlmouth TaxID=2419978 RepID=A0A3G2KGD5_9CAUD|nr:methyltransferase [Mycobacterium phage Fowlmouth]AYN58025.1 hypothetical protein SEA_FOWLMOUTH_76 [Mycobacterium phage Fowlmouth]